MKHLTDTQLYTVCNDILGPIIFSIMFIRTQKGSLGQWLRWVSLRTTEAI